MSDRVLPDWTPTDRVGDPRCGSQPAPGAETCGAPATWHVLWTVATPAPLSLLCDKHMTQARRELVYTDRHPAAVICDMPGTGWLMDTPSRCVLTTTTQLSVQTREATQ
ncbi:hypothetical protein ACFVT1_36535 [Streptomyces sp. NPDC057963]|uniref:hypothetical protein n=1 Tax=Streptomyces sp. NPDC057963 TaxID=3346290 RepID=UPI0036E8E5B7